MKIASSIFIVILAALTGSAAAGQENPASAAQHLPDVKKAGQEAWAPVASWANRPEVNKKEGARVLAILKAANIPSTAPSSAGVTLSVPASSETAARKLLAKAIQDEDLKITLLKMNAKGDRALVVTPESVLEKH